MMKKSIALLNLSISKSLIKKFFNIKIFYPLNTGFIKNSKRNFSTGNQVEDKNALEFIEAGVFEVLKSAAKCKHDKLSRSATLDELGFDSLDQVELVVALEEKFNVTLSGK